MTEEQWKKRNEMITEYKENVKKARYVRDGYFITLDVYKNFLKEHGYILTAYDGGGNINWDRKYMNFFEFYDDFERHLSGNMILVGNPEDWGEYMRGYWCDNIVNNPFVKYIKTSFTTFKIFTVVENEESKNCGFGFREEPYYCAKLEKDLSKEWMKYLVKVCPEFAEYMNKECENKKEEAHKEEIDKQCLIRKRYEELKKELEQLPIEKNKVIAQNNEIISTIKEAQEELKQSI